MKQMALRLDEATMGALEKAADAAGVSREGFVRSLIAKELGVKVQQRAQGSYKRYTGEVCMDQRVRKSRDSGRSLAELTAIRKAIWAEPGGSRKKGAALLPKGAALPHGVDKRARKGKSATR